MKYIILQSEGMAYLQDKVNLHIKHGYKPQGGIFVRDIGMSAYYVQAMIKE